MVQTDHSRQLMIVPQAGLGTSMIAGPRFAFIDDPQAHELFELMTAPDQTWGSLVRKLAKQIAGKAYDHPALALFEVTPDGTSCFIYGDVRTVLTTSSGEQRLETADVSTWFETRISEEVSQFEVGSANGEEVGRISSGYVSSGGFVAAFGHLPQQLEAPTPAAIEDSPSATPPEPEPEETEAETEVELEEQAEAFDQTLTTAITATQLQQIKTEAQEPVSEADPIAEADPIDEAAAADEADPIDEAAPVEAGEVPNPGFVLPNLRGLRCPVGHLNSMQDTQCRTCGAPIDSSGAMADGPRPTLGILTLDDGTELALDSPVVFGRNVPEPYSIEGEAARVITLTDDDNMISRVHLEIHLSGWDIELVDKASANGSFSSPIDALGTKTRLRSEVPTAIVLETIVELGGRSFTLTAGPNLR